MCICVFVQQLTEVIIYQVKCICELTLLVKPEPEFRQTVVIEDMKSFLALIIIREAQIKTTDYNFAPMRRAKIKKTNNKCW